MTHHKFMPSCNRVTRTHSYLLMFEHIMNMTYKFKVLYLLRVGCLGTETVKLKKEVLTMFLELLSNKPIFVILQEY